MYVGSTIEHTRFPFFDLCCDWSITTFTTYSATPAVVICWIVSGLCLKCIILKKNSLWCSGKLLWDFTHLISRLKTCCGLRHLKDTFLSTLLNIWSFSLLCLSFTAVLSLFSLVPRVPSDFVYTALPQSVAKNSQYSHITRRRRNI